MGVATGVIGIGMAVLKLILELADKNKVVSVVDGVIEISAIGMNQFEKRSGERKLQSIADRISLTCKSVLDESKISPERQDVIIEDIISIINHIDVSHAVMVKIRANPQHLQKSLEQTGASILRAYDLTEQELCQRLFNYISNFIVSHSIETIEFGNTALIQLLESFDSLERKIEEDSKRIRAIEQTINTRTPDKKRYETQYRSNIISRYETIRLLGASSLTRDEKKYSLDVGYISLELSDHSNSISLQKAVQKYKTIWLTGEAGSGKSTLLQWLAVNYARNSFVQQNSDNDYLPILIELKKTDPDNHSLQEAIAKIMEDEDINQPEGWLSSLLKAGKVVLLLDGVDEIKREYRDSILDWIDELRKKYPNIKIVISSRPQVVERITEKPTEITILPMTHEKIDEYIEYWHEAVLIENLKLDRKEVEICKTTLRESLTKNEPIRRIASNPLLCAMICALHYNNGTIRSASKNELYEDCCKMLLSARDEAKNVLAYSEIPLNYQEKKSILARFAYWVMKNGIGEATIEEFCKKIEQSLKSFDSPKQNYSVELLSEYFIERSGLLLIPETDHLDFIHRSFLEYLAAFEIYMEDDWGFLCQQADDESWLETLVLSMCFANQKRAEWLLNSILKAKDAKHTIIAATCATNATSLSSSLRNTIEKRLSSIIPPRSYSASEKLAKVGNAVTPFLAFNCLHSNIQHSYCLDTLYHINTVQALRVAFSYLVPTITEDSVDTLGSMLTLFSPHEIRESGIGPSIRSYIREKAEAAELLVSDLFFKVLLKEELQELKPYFEKILRLSIFNFENYNALEVYQMFQNLVDLTVVGDFDDNSIFESLATTLKHVSICDYNEDYDIYSLNNTHIQPEKFALHTNAPLYFSGADLEFLHNVRELGVFAYNPEAEIMLDDITQLKKLERISIYNPCLCDYWERLVQKTSNIELVLMAQDEYQKSSIESSFEEFGRYCGTPNVKVKRMTFPYGDLRMR